MSDKNRDMTGPEKQPGIDGDDAVGSGEDSAQLDPAMQAHIGRYLRHLYDDVVQQPVPDRFVRLLEELERKSAERK